MGEHQSWSQQLSGRNAWWSVKLVIVLKDSSLRKEYLIEFCMIQLTGYKRLRQVDFRENCRKHLFGETLRRTLRDAVKK